MPRNAAVAVIALAAVPLSAVAAADGYTLDPLHTSLSFAIDHLGLAMIHGRFSKYSGKFSLDRAAKTGGVELVVQTASVDTNDNDKGNRPRSRDEHLRSPDFFNVAEFPRMTFRGQATKWTGEAFGVVEGQLTLLGVTKPLTLTMDSWKCGPDPRTQGKRYMCGGNATGKIKRTDFGMKTGVPSIGDEVTLLISFEALKD